MKNRDNAEVEATSTVYTREQQIRHERDMIAAAFAELNAGQGLSGEALEVWLTAWERGDEIPSEGTSPAP